MRKYLLNLNFNDQKKKKRERKREWEGRGAIFLTSCCGISRVMGVQGGVFSQLTVSISHVTDMELNWTERTLESRRRGENGLLFRQSFIFPLQSTVQLLVIVNTTDQTIFFIIIIAIDYVQSSGNKYQTKFKIITPNEKRETVRHTGCISQR